MGGEIGVDSRAGRGQHVLVHRRASQAAARRRARRAAGAPMPPGCACWSSTTTRPTARSSPATSSRAGHACDGGRRRAGAGAACARPPATGEPFERRGARHARCRRWTGSSSRAAIRRGAEPARRRARDADLDRRRDARRRASVGIDALPDQAGPPRAAAATRRRRARRARGERRRRAADAAASRGAAGRSRATRRVLVAEDNEVNQLVDRGDARQARARRRRRRATAARRSRSSRTRPYDARLHGLPDARARRLRGDRAGSARASAASDARRPDRGDDRARDGRRPRALPRGRDGRLPRQAAAHRGRSTPCSSAGSASRPTGAPVDRRRGGVDALVDEARMRTLPRRLPGHRRPAGGRCSCRARRRCSRSCAPRSTARRRGACAAPRTSSRAAARTSARPSWRRSAARSRSGDGDARADARPSSSRVRRRPKHGAAPGADRVIVVAVALALSPPSPWVRRCVSGGRPPTRARSAPATRRSPATCRTCRCSLRPRPADPLLEGGADAGARLASGGVRRPDCCLTSCRPSGREELLAHCRAALAGESSSHDWTGVREAGRVYRNVHVPLRDARGARGRRHARVPRRHRARGPAPRGRGAARVPRRRSRAARERRRDLRRLRPAAGIRCDHRRACGPLDWPEHFGLRSADGRTQADPRPRCRCSARCRARWSRTSS